MTENKMADVAKLLGVELGEEFIIKNKNSMTFRITENGVQLFGVNGQWYETNPEIINRLLTGDYEIKEKPWKPEIGEQYFFPSLESALGFDCYKFHEGDDRLIINKFIACKTREEAVELHDWIVSQVKRHRGIE